jgi:hypothetical protein
MSVIGRDGQVCAGAEFDAHASASNASKPLGIALVIGLSSVKC